MRLPFRDSVFVRAVKERLLGITLYFPDNPSTPKHDAGRTA